ncbi:MAG: amidohydrolase [Phycisphaerales bacterium]|nr:amidohydrolase [Phycisphaerales bacterium]
MVKNERIRQVLAEVTAFRRALHTHPELSYEEFQTACKVRDVLAGLPNLTLLKPLIGTDVVAVLNEGRSGPCLALRADMDALPITEETDVPYRSAVPGVMHACGHDGHTAILLGTAMVLTRMADELPGRVVFVFQPGEEEGGGGGKLCATGILEQLKVDAAVALHGWPIRPVGSIAVSHGPATAANNEFEITITGKSGHGAAPQRCVDPIVIAAHLVTALQTLVSRTVDPLQAAVVTIGQMVAGTASNVIPEQCHLKGTLRYMRDEVGEQLRRSLGHLVEHTAIAHGARSEMSIREGYPPLHNDPGLTELVEQAAGDLLGQDHVYAGEPPSMGVEDFAFYAQRVPAVLVRLGLRPSDAETCPTLHNAKFDFNDDALPVGMRLFCELTRRFLERNP